MGKLHLVAHVPNEGARRLAWAIGEAWEATLTGLARAGVDRAMVDRLLTGELTPGADMAAAVQSATESRVLWTDWYRRAEGAWFEQPSLREAPRQPVLA